MFVQKETQTDTVTRPALAAVFVLRASEQNVPRRHLIYGKIAVTCEPKIPTCYGVLGRFSLRNFKGKELQRQLSNAYRCCTVVVLEKSST